MTLHSLREGWRIALDQLRANKLRSALTVLGVVIGIATVMSMASIVAGFREQIVNTLEVVGPTTFRVLRYFSTTGVNPDAVPREIRVRPKLQAQDAEAIARLPEIHYAAIWTQVFQRFEYGGNHTRILGVFGADDRFMEILGGGLMAGRSFTSAELRGGEPVAIIEQRTIAGAIRSASSACGNDPQTSSKYRGRPRSPQWCRSKQRAATSSSTSGTASSFS